MEVMLDEEEELEEVWTNEEKMAKDEDDSS